MFEELVPLPGLAPSQAPQSACREDDGEERGHAECYERPDEEETPAADGPEADSRPSHVDDGETRRKERHDKDDDVPRSSSGERQSSVQPDEQEEHRNEVRELSRSHPTDDVVRMVKRRKEDREQRRDG